MLLGMCLLGLAALSEQALQSPCPDILTYEELSPKEPSRWYGRVTFPPGNPHWLYLTIVLDNKADLLGNWLGEVTTKNNQEFNIDNPEMKTRKEPIRFFVKHNPEDPTPPKVHMIKLDGREICNADKLVIAPVPQAPIETITTKLRPDDGTHSSYIINYYDNTVQCGVVKLNNPVSLAVDGAPTLEGQWPWQIALYRTKGVNNNYICGGTLVSHRHVVTAAHCTTTRNSKPPQKVGENTLTVYLGKHDLITSVIGVQILLVERITVHPEFDPTTFSRDVSVLLLQEPAQYTSRVQPACLWPDHLSDLTHVIGKKGSVVGWGNDGSGKLLLVDMPVVSQETCLRSKGDFYIRVTSEYTYCAGLRNGQSACNGDSGGGMVFPMNGAWYLRGVVSVALSKDNEAVCDPSHYVVFTDLAKMLPWIRENIEPY